VLAGDTTLVELAAAVASAGRRGDPHAGEPDPGLLEIPVGAVLAALDRLA
jgi:hypothetical protein